jgi:hypothetical protein
VSQQAKPASQQGASTLQGLLANEVVAEEALEKITANPMKSH